MPKDCKIIERRGCKDFDIVIIEHFNGMFYSVHTAKGDQIDLTNKIYDKLTEARKIAALYS